MVNSNDQAKCELDANGNPYVMVNGEKQKVLINDKG